MNDFGKLVRRMVCMLTILVLLMPTQVFASDGQTVLSSGQCQNQRGLIATIPLTGAVSQTVGLIVTVQTSSGTTLTGARVALQQPDNYAQTDAEGNALLWGLLPGYPYAIIVSHSGYDTQTISYTYKLSKVDGSYPLDQLNVTLRPTAGSNTDGDSSSGHPEEDTSNGDTGNTGSGSTYGSSSGSRSDLQGIVLRPERGSDTIEITESVIAESIRGEKDILLVFPESGGAMLVLPFYTEHDRDVQNSGKVLVTQKNGSFLLTIKVPKENTNKTVVGIPHNVISMVLKNELDVYIDVEEDTEKSFLIASERLDHIASEDVDLIVEYDRLNDSVSFVIMVQTEAHGLTDSALISGEAFGLAKENGLELVCRIYDANMGTDVWYEWIFRPQELKKLKKKDIKDVDLYVRTAPAETDPILSLTQGSWCQYIIMEHNGVLPVKAVLRVKNLEQFPSSLKMMLVSAGTKKLKTIHTGLFPSDDDWYSFDIARCGSYALTAAPDALILEPAVLEPVEITSSPWHWIAVGSGILLLLLAVLLSLRHKKERKRSERPTHRGNIIDIDWEVISENGRDQA